MDHLLEIAKSLAEFPRVASSSEDFLKSADSVGDGVKNLMNLVNSIEAEEAMGHLPSGVSAKTKRLVLDLFTQQTSDIQKVNDILLHILTGTGNL